MVSRPVSGRFEHYEGNWIMEQTYIPQILLQMVRSKVLPKQEAQDTQIDFY